MIYFIAMKYLKKELYNSGTKKLIELCQLMKLIYCDIRNPFHSIVLLHIFIETQKDFSCVSLEFQFKYDRIQFLLTPSFSEIIKRGLNFFFEVIYLLLWYIY